MVQRFRDSRTHDSWSSEKLIDYRVSARTASHLLTLTDLNRFAVSFLPAKMVNSKCTYVIENLSFKDLVVLRYFDRELLTIRKFGCYFVSSKRV